MNQILRPLTFFSKINSFRQFFAVFGLFVYICFSTSCISNKNLKYFNNLSDSDVVKLPPVTRQQATIMPDDLLEIKIAGANEATAALLNSYSTGTISGGNTTGNTNNSGYLVDQNGDIEFPIMGKVRAAGLTREEFKERLKERVSKYLKDPLVSVRFTNFRFTVLGEVKTPGSFVVPNEKVTILEALGLAGDMTSYSRRNGVRVLRDSSGIREVGLVDFSDKSLFTSKYYYLQRNDIVYIEAEKYKGQYEDITRVSTVLATVVSLIALTITIIRR
jgi:polysaccharide export outer membrane protein